MFYAGNWIHSFPQHFQWSNATFIAKDMAPYAAVALKEIDRVVQRLHQRIDEPHAWWEEWTAVAAQVEREAGTAEKLHGLSSSMLFIDSLTFYVSRNTLFRWS